MAYDEKTCAERGVRLTHCEAAIRSIEAKLDKVIARPPVWTTFLISAMTGFIGYLIALMNIKG